MCTHTPRCSRSARTRSTAAKIRPRRLRGIPLVRIVNGAAAAARLWRDTTRAAYAIRRRSALDAGLALGAIGDEEGALAAYRLSQDVVGLDGDGFATVAGLIKEASLRHAMKQDAEAKPLDHKIERLLAHADPGVREALERLE